MSSPTDREPYDQGEVVPPETPAWERPASRPGDDARFFAGHEHFWIGHLCNHWSARVLNAAGLPVRPLRAVTSAEVMRTVGEAVKLDSGAPRA